MSDSSIFSAAELEFLQSQRLCRIATAGADGQPHVTPVAFRYNADGTFDIGGHGSFATRKKWRDVTQNPQVALVFDDIPSLDPWRARGIEIRGTVETHLSGGETILPGFGPEYFRVTPERVIAWGIDNENPYAGFNARKVK